MNGAPIIKIELEQMRQTIIHSLGKHNQELEKAVNEELKKAVENYDFATEVQKIANQVITESISKSIKYYFEYGSEGKKIIDATIKDLFDQINNGMQK